MGRDEPAREPPGDRATSSVVRRLGALSIPLLVVIASVVIGVQSRRSPNPEPTPVPHPTATESASDDAPVERLTTRELFGHSCGPCHSLRAAGVHAEIGPDLDRVARTLSAARIRQQIRTGTLDSAMPPNLLTGSDARRVARYVARVAGRHG